MIGKAAVRVFGGRLIEVAKTHYPMISNEVIKTFTGGKNDLKLKKIILNSNYTMLRFILCILV